MIEELRSHELGTRVRLVSMRRDALSIPAVWNGEDRVWLVDAVISGRPVGSIHTLGHRDLFASTETHAHAHWLSLSELLGWIIVARPDMADVRFRLWGVEAAAFTPGQSLDPRVRVACSGLTDVLLSALDRSF